MEGITFLENCWISLAIFPFKCFHWCQWCLHFWSSHFSSLSTCTSLTAFTWFPIAPYTVHLWLKFMFSNCWLEWVELHKCNKSLDRKISYPLPGHLLKLHFSGFVDFPRQNSPFFSITVLFLVFILNPVSHVLEHRPSFQGPHSHCAIERLDENNKRYSSYFVRWTK